MIDKNRSPHAAGGSHALKDRGVKRPPSSSPEDTSSRRKYQKDQPNQTHSLNRDLSERPKLRADEGIRNLDNVSLASEAQLPRDVQEGPWSGQEAVTSSVKALSVGVEGRHSPLRLATHEPDNNATEPSPTTNRPEKESTQRQSRSALDDSIGGCMDDTSADPFIMALVDFLDQSSKWAAFQLSRQQAQAQLTRTTREYNSMQPQFGGFPGIMEQRQHIRDKAEAHLARQTELCNAERAEQMRKARAFAEKWPALIINELGSRTDHVSRDDYDALESRVIKLEEMYAFKVNEIEILSNVNARMFKEIEASRAVENASHDKLASHISKHVQLQQDVDGLQGRLTELRTIADGLNESQNTIISKIQSEVGELRKSLGFKIESRQEEFRKELKRVDDRSSAIEKRQDTEQHYFIRKTEFRDLMSRVDNGATQIQLLQEATEQGQKIVERVNPGTSDHVTSLLENRVVELAEDIVTCRNVMESMQEESSGRDKVLLDTMEKLQEKCEEIVTDLKATGDRLATLENRQTDLYRDVGNLQIQLSSSVKSPQFASLVPQNLAKREPRAGSFSTHTPEAQGVQSGTHTSFPADVLMGGTDSLKNSNDTRSTQETLTMLEQATKDHKRRLDNLTTDVVVRQMMDQFVETYSPAGDLAQTLDALRSDLAKDTTAVEKQNTVINGLVTEVRKMQEGFSRVLGRMRALEA